MLRPIKRDTSAEHPEEGEAWFEFQLEVGLELKEQVADISIKTRISAKLMLSNTRLSGPS
jgi:hypothetical protein